MIEPQRDGQKIGPVYITPPSWDVPHGYKEYFERCHLAREKVPSGGRNPTHDHFYNIIFPDDAVITEPSKEVKRHFGGHSVVFYEIRWGGYTMAIVRRSSFVVPSIQWVEGGEQ